MGIRRWIRRRLSGGSDSEDTPPRGALVDAMLRRRDPQRALGEYDRDSYPEELADALRKRQEVADILMDLDLTDPEVRRQSIPRLRELLRAYPHPIAYEALIHAYVDAGRWDEARGVAYSIEARRRECEGSPYPEICAETDHLKGWSADEVEAIRREREGSGSGRT